MTTVVKVGKPSPSTTLPDNTHRLSGDLFAAEPLQPGDACFIASDKHVYKSFAALAPTGLETILVTNNGYGYLEPPTVAVAAPTGTAGGNVQATAEAVIDPLAGSISHFVVTNPGNGYIVVPAITVTPVNGGVGGAATALLQDDGFSASAVLHVDGYSATICAVGDAVTLYEDINWRYGSGLTPGYVYLSALIPGALDTAPSAAAPLPIGKILDGQRIRLWRSYYGGNEGILANIGALVSQGGATQPIGVKKVVKVPLAGGTDTAGGLGNWVNPEAGSIIITRSYLDVTTIATGTCTVDVGTTAVSATTAATNLISGGDAHAATGIVGANTTVAKLAAGKWVTASNHAGGASAGLVANLYIEYQLA